MSKIEKPARHSFSIGCLLATLAFAGILTWMYLPVFSVLSARWSRDPQYSHGFLVPIMALGIAWFRWTNRDSRHQPPTLQGSWIAIFLLLLALVFKISGVLFYFDWLDHISIIPAVAAIIALFGGKQLLAMFWPAILFLVFMIPLPYRIDTAMATNLRTLGTKMSTYALQSFGLPAFSEGNLIVLQESTLEVADVCSGLRMLMTFFALSAAMAIILTDRPLWERALLLASAVPIAILANVGRIVATGFLYQVMEQTDELERIVHDWAGFGMMPVGIVLLMIELWVLKRLFIVEQDSPRIKANLAV